MFQANTGLAGARNAGIALARGRYVLPFDQDDLLDPGMVEACTAILDTKPKIDLVYTDRQEFGDVEAVWTVNRFELQRLKYFNQLSYCGLYRRHMWEAVGGYRTNVSGFDDWDFWIAAAALGFRGEHVRLPYFKQRKREGSQMSRILGDYDRLFAQIIVNNSEVYLRRRNRKRTSAALHGRSFPLLSQLPVRLPGTFNGKLPVPPRPDLASRTRAPPARALTGRRDPS